VAYLDLDSAALGPDLAANASPSLKEAIADAAGGVARPASADRSPFEAWLARKEDPQRPGRPFIGDLGGGSDHVGFLCHLGVPSAALSARGAPGTAYHSAYDDLAWYRKVVGEDYASARLVTQVVSLLVARLANADLVPLDPAASGLEVGRHLAALGARARHEGWEADLGRVEAAAERFARRAQGAREGWVERLEKGLLGDDDLRRLNERIRRGDRLWTVPAGLPGRPWFRNLLSAPDEDSGYAPSLLPALRAPFERRERAALEGAERLYLEAFSRLEDEVPAPLDLDSRVKALLAGFPGRVSLFAKNLDTGEAYGERADERVRTASTIKVPILIEAYARVEEGRAHWDDPLLLREAGKVGGAGVLRELGEGLRLTLRDAVNLMILISDNTATNLVLDALSADAVNARMEALGLQSTRALRRVGGGGDSRAAEDPANKPFGLGVSTPREMVTLLERLEAGEVVSPSAAREMIDLLKRQQYHDGIGRTLRGVPLATKPGALDHLRSDVGIVYSPRGRIAMAITCEDLPEVDYTPDNPGHLLISRLSLLLEDGLGRPSP
jgi:beta-lactamase class A